MSEKRPPNLTLRNRRETKTAKIRIFGRFCSLFVDKDTNIFQKSKNKRSVSDVAPARNVPADVAPCYDAGRVSGWGCTGSRARVRASCQSVKNWAVRCTPRSRCASRVRAGGLWNCGIWTAQPRAHARGLSECRKFRADVSRACAHLSKVSKLWGCQMSLNLHAGRHRRTQRRALGVRRIRGACEPLRARHGFALSLRLMSRAQRRVCVLCACAECRNCGCRICLRARPHITRATVK